MDRILRILLRIAIGLRLDRGPSCFLGFGNGTRMPLPTASSVVWFSNTVLMERDMAVEKASPAYFNSSFWIPSGTVARPFRSDFCARWISSGVIGWGSGRVGSPVKGTSGSVVCLFVCFAAVLRVCGKRCCSNVCMDRAGELH